MIKRFPVFAFVALVAAATVSVRAQTSNAQNKAHSFGALENGVYHNNLTGIDFTVPSDWVIVSQSRSSTEDAQVIKLKNSISKQVGTVWLKQRNADPADLEVLMKGRLDDKASQRNNFQDYRDRPESVQHLTIGGRPALSAVADYVSAGQKMVEYLTWVDGEKSRVVFVGRIPASELADFQTRFDPLIQSAVVP